MSQQQTFKNTIYFPKGTRRYNFVYDLENAGIAQIITRTLLAPIERWRLFSQTQNSLNSGFVRYNGFNDFVQGRFGSKLGTLKTEGVKGLFRSNAANCWLFLYQLGCQHLFYENVNHRVDHHFSKEGILYNYNEYTFFKNTLKILAINFYTLLITYPIQTARVRLALNTPGQSIKELPYRGVTDTLRYTSLFNRKGIRQNTYRGFLFGNLTSLVYFSTYNTLYKMVQEQPQIADRKQFSYFPLTLLGSLPAILLTYPLDTVKHRLQLNSKNQGELFSIRDAIKQILQQPKQSFYKGLVPSLTKHVLSVPIFFGILNLKYKNNLNYF